MSLTVEPGARFAGYQVESMIGRGGMGVVYRAIDLSLERPVALKLLAPELTADPRFSERFLREPRLAAALDHPNVVPIYEAGEHDGHLYLAMRYVEGGDLKTILARERKLAPARLLTLLAQIAGALDAAHRRGLVHRDVKPANVLVGEDDHAYLSDFGITKKLGADSTDTGGAVGTLDYLAPEQIRGDPVDGRTDCYSLACVLYECLSGAPPFRRATDAETMWAHMQEAPAPTRGHPKLDPVLRRGLAKDKDDRYATCVELIEAAADALGLARPAPHPYAPPALVRRRRAIFAIGLALLAGSVAAAIVALGGDGESRGDAVGNGIAALDAESGKVTAAVTTSAVPGNVAVGEGAVWALSGDASVLRIDPESREVVRKLRPGGVPSEIAAGEGAVWIGNAGGEDVTNAVVGIARIDPRSGRVTRRTKLPGAVQGVLPSAGLPRIAVGAGAVWAINPDGGISKIDPKSGKVVATLKGLEALTLAAGEEGVWYLSLADLSSVKRIDPRTSRIAETIRVGAEDLWGVAVGAGSVWATAREQGVVWRIEPGRKPVTRTIDVGFGVTFAAFGAGALWTGNYVDGTVSRIDPSGNRVTARTPVGTPQSLAAGSGAAWVAAAGGQTPGPLTNAACSEVASGGRDPDVLIASDLPLRGGDSANPRAMAAAIRFALERNGFRAGRHRVGYQSCDVTTPETGGFEFRRCAANASAYANAERLVAVIGTYSSFCAQVEIPILNRAPGGPLAMVSPSNTGAGLTRGGRLAELRGEPDIYYPTGTRNYLRVIAREDLQGVANALLAKRLGLRRVFALHDKDDWEVIHGAPFVRAARQLGLEVAGSERFDSESEDVGALVRAVERSRAQGVFVSGQPSPGAIALLKALRARFGDRVKIMITDIFVPVSGLLEELGTGARGIYMSATEIAPRALELSPSAARFARGFGAFETPTPWALRSAQATQVILRAIARSDGSRESVLRQLRTTEVKNGLLGTFRFDRNGDITPAKLMIVRITGRTPPDEGLFPEFQGAVVDRVLTVPERLAD